MVLESNRWCPAAVLLGQASRPSAVRSASIAGRCCRAEGNIKHLHVASPYADRCCKLFMGLSTFNRIIQLRKALWHLGSVERTSGAHPGINASWGSRHQDISLQPIVRLRLCHTGSSALMLVRGAALAWQWALTLMHWLGYDTPRMTYLDTDTCTDAERPASSQAATPSRRLACSHQKANIELGQPHWNAFEHQQ